LEICELRIGVWVGLVTMPVLGAIDNSRAQQMMDVLLQAVVRKSCRYAIIDVTAVETVDTGTADHIVRVIRALRMLGAQGIVVGIRPDVAQTMVSLGVDLSAIVTLATLRDALLYCVPALRGVTVGR
jgi:anti-anti-sigma regulatory factor